MDYIVNSGEKVYIIEAQKNKVKDKIIDQYVALRKAKGLSQEKIANIQRDY